jgi:translation initiation factor eIF-2B subunit gamma
MNTHPVLTSLRLPKAELLAPKGLDQNTGTAEIFRLPELRSLIKSDFVVLPCDLVCELGGDKLLHAWMIEGRSLTDQLGGVSLTASTATSTHSGGLGVWYETKTATAVKGEGTDFVAVAPLPPMTARPPKTSLVSHLSKVVYAMPSDTMNDLADERKGLPVRHGLLRKHPRLRMLTTHRDAHIYVLPRWLMDFMNENSALETLGEDVIGWWAKASWQAGLDEKLKITDIMAKLSKREDDEYPTPYRDGSPSLDSSMIATPQGGAGNASQDAGAPTSKSEEEVPPILGYIHPADPTSQLIRRVDSSALLLAVSLQLAKLPSIEEAGPAAASVFAHPRKVAYPEGIKSRTTIARQDSLIAESVTVDEKTSIKESVIGASCQIQESVKLMQCLLMEGVVVGKGCKLTRCIIGKRCVIGEGSVLTDVEVQENLLVEPKSELFAPPTLWYCLWRYILTMP